MRTGPTLIVVAIALAAGFAAALLPAQTNPPAAASTSAPASRPSPPAQRSRLGATAAPITAAGRKAALEVVRRRRAEDRLAQALVAVPLGQRHGLGEHGVFQAEQPRRRHGLRAHLALDAACELDAGGVLSEGHQGHSLMPEVAR